MFTSSIKINSAWTAVLLAFFGLIYVTPAQGADTASAPKDPATAGVADRAQAAMPLVLLLRDRSVRNDLRLTSKQVADVDKVVADVDYPLWSVRDSKNSEVQAKCALAFDHLEKNLDSTLQPTQRRRLDGILLQSHGWPAMLLPKFSQRLNLSADQQSRIRDLLKPGEKSKDKSNSDPLPADKQKLIRSVLTETQQTQLSQLVGPAFDASKIRGRYSPAPAFVEVAEWINTEPLTREQLNGKVVAVHFWAFGCINCVRNLPHYQSWQEKLADKGLVIVGLHTPETQAERVVEAVRAKVGDNKIKYPVGIDAAGKNWNAWSNHMWPSVYLIDKQGFVRYWWYGELNWEGAKGEEYMRQKIEELLAERD